MINGLRTWLAMGVAGSVMACASSAAAGAFYIQEQSVKGAGRAFSGEVTDTGAESMLWNPAAIGRLEGKEVYSGLFGVKVDGTVTDEGSTLQRPTLNVPSALGTPIPGLPGGVTGLLSGVLPGLTNGVLIPTLNSLPNIALLPPQPVGGNPVAKDPIPKSVVPNFAFAMPVTDRIAVGIGINAPFNAITTYDGDSWVRYGAIKSRFLNINMQTAVSMRVTNWLNVGVGGNVDYFDATFSQMAPDLIAPFPDGKIEVKGSDTRFGWNAGAQLRPAKWATIGASYRSGYKHHLDGDVTIYGFQGPFALVTSKQEATTNFDLPWIATGGVTVRPMQRLALHAQVQRFGWSDFDNVRVDLKGAGQLLPGALLPKSITVHEFYNDTTNVAVGADFAVTDWLTVRAGAQKDPTPTNDLYRDPRVPDGDRKLYSVGTTITPKPGMHFDLSAAYIKLKDSAIHSDQVLYDGTAFPMNLSLRGRSEGKGLVIGGGARFTF
ncbi:MAG: outer membrane protein transport protein [Caulobacter sp.]|nr:outer membrane protein transport protein [Caulobacter sp.]